MIENTSWIEALWIGMTLSGIMVNGLYLRQSWGRYKIIKEYERRRPVIYASLGHVRRDMFRFAQQWLLLIPGLNSTRHPSPPTTLEVKVVVGCFMLAELLLVLAAITDARGMSKLIDIEHVSSILRRNGDKDVRSSTHGS